MVEKVDLPKKKSEKSYDPNQANSFIRKFEEFTTTNKEKEKLNISSDLTPQHK